MKDLKALPGEVRVPFGHALYTAQLGSKTPNTKALRGYAGAGVLEVIENHDTDTFRCVYTVKFDDAVYLLHAFQKKSKHGIKLSQKDINLIGSRLKLAQADYDARQAEKNNGKT